MALEGNIEHSSRIIFVLGPPRSGTTLLQSILIRSQPQIIGSQFESKLYNLHSRNSYTRETILQEEFYTELLSPEELDALISSNDNFLDLFRAYTLRVMEVRGKNYFSDKYPLHILWHKEIARDFPESKWILITRDPSAGIHSYATTRISWWRIGADKLPFGIGKIKWVRYLNAFWAYFYFIKELRKVRSHKNCVIEISHEDLVLQPEKFKKLFAESFGFDLADLDPSRPASSVIHSTENAFVRESLDAYKKQMPGWAKWISGLAFYPQKGFRTVWKFFVLLVVIYPGYLSKKLINSLRGQHS